jgi:arylsulfatase
LAWEHQGNHAIRHGDWKLVSAHDSGGGWELYNLRDDRTELKDLSTKNPAQAERLATAYQRWAEQNRVLPWPVARKT